MKLKSGASSEAPESGSGFDKAALASGIRVGGEGRRPPPGFAPCWQLFRRSGVYLWSAYERPAHHTRLTTWIIT
jgi:hypothetical protein